MVCARQDHSPSDACMDCAREKYSDLLQSHHSLCGKVAQLDHDKEVLIGQRDQAYAEKDAAVLQVGELQKELAYSKEVEITGDRLLADAHRLLGEANEAAAKWVETCFTENVEARFKTSYLTGFIGGLARSYRDGLHLRPDEKRVDLAPERPFTAEELQKLKDSPFKGPPA